MSSSTIALIILAITIVFFVSGKIPLSITAVGAALAMGVFGIIPFSSVFAGFSNDVTMMVIGSMVLGEALFETGVAQKIGSTIIKMVGTKEKVFIVTVVVVTAILSAFLSNTAVVAIMMPMIAATAASSRGVITKKNTFMAVGFAANIGGGMTLVGSTPNVVGQGLLNDAGLASMSFFDLTLGSIPRLLFIVAFYATVGCAIQNKVFNFPEVEDENMATMTEGKKYNKSKMVISTVILVLTVIGFISGIWTVGAVAMIAALACVITGCITIKQVFARLDWTTVWVLAGSLGFAAGISQSGAGQMIADVVIGFLGENISMFSLMIVFTLLSVVLGNLMSSTATMALLGPIAISMCTTLGFEAKPIFMAIIWSLNLAFLNPVATPPVTMTLQAGYRFLDYTKIGAILMAGCLILTIVMYPIIFHL
uniref:SLC13 family permease n=1 Tax=Coprococcus catus TaxID=116085 RepID=UPI0022E0D83B|nr:SLC13 family permease [Coprococcus catus]